jgi:hypothetical protein
MNVASIAAFDSAEREYYGAWNEPSSTRKRLLRSSESYIGLRLLRKAAEKATPEAAPRISPRHEQ